MCATVKEAKLSVEDSAHGGSDLKAKMDQAAADLAARRKGVDLCFIVDCTGSMVRAIRVRGGMSGA